MKSHEIRELGATVDFGLNADGTRRIGAVRQIDSADFVAHLQAIRAARPGRYDRSERVRKAATIRALAECIFAPVLGDFSAPAHDYGFSGVPQEGWIHWRSAWYDEAGRLFPDTFETRLALLSNAKVLEDVLTAASLPQTFEADKE